MWNIEIIKNPWDDVLYELVSKTKNKFCFTSPFITEAPTNKILSNLKEWVDLNWLTSIKLPSFRRGALSINALDGLQQKWIIKNVWNLHSKIYIFDDQKAIVTSGNLTNGWLINNFEYGLLVKDEMVVNKILWDFDILYNDKNSLDITNEKITKIRDLLDSLPKIKEAKIDFDLDLLDKISEEEKIIVENKLRWWKKLVFDVVGDKCKTIFYMKDLLAFENFFKSIYPNNDNIEAKLRQQLQELRDLGLIEFLWTTKKWIYKKLW